MSKCHFKFLPVAPFLSSFNSLFICSDWQCKLCFSSYFCMCYKLETPFWSLKSGKFCLKILFSLNLVNHHFVLRWFGTIHSRFFYIFKVVTFSINTQIFQITWCILKLLTLPFPEDLLPNSRDKQEILSKKQQSQARVNNGDKAELWLPRKSLGTAAVLPK